MWLNYLCLHGLQVCIHSGRPAELLSIFSLRPCGCRGAPRLPFSCQAAWRLLTSPLWLQVRSSGGQQSPFYAELEAAQSAAEASGLGIWSKVSQDAAMHLAMLLAGIA